MAMTDELLIIDNFMSKDECEFAVHTMEELIQKGFTYQSRENSLDRKDQQFYAHSNYWLANAENNDFWPEFQTRYYDVVIPEYLERFPILKEKQLETIECKFQKTMPSGGFHRWHYENFSATVANRVLTYSLFLNEGYGGGETEFLHYRKRAEPKTGRLCVFPAHWGATHRGNPPLNGPKYIATGWTIDVHPYAEFNR